MSKFVKFSTNFHPKVTGGSFKAPSMDDLLKAADRLLDKEGKAEVMALKAQYEDAYRKNFPLRTAPQEPNWDAMSKDLPPAFQVRGFWSVCLLYVCIYPALCV